MINLHTKFEASVFTHYEDMKGMQKVEFGVVWELEMTQGQWQCDHFLEHL